MTVPSKLPASFAAMGFVTPEQARHAGSRFRRLMIATEGGSDTGKTEFLLTCPGPGCIQAWDRGFDAIADNPQPPKTRRADFGIQVVKVPMATDFTNAKQYAPYWLEGLKGIMAVLVNPEVRTFAIDGDNVSWELQRLAEHGKLTNVFPQTKYTDVYSARRALYARMWDSGKIIVCTNMMREEYEDVLDPDGKPVPDPDRPGETKRRKTGEMISSGFSTNKREDYYWQIRIRHLYEPPKGLRRDPETNAIIRPTPAKWGFRIRKCKANPRLEGTELWGEEATFTGLVKLVYPQIPLAEWGL